MPKAPKARRMLVRGLKTEADKHHDSPSSRVCVFPACSTLSTVTKRVAQAATRHLSRSIAGEVTMSRRAASLVCGVSDGDDPLVRPYVVWTLAFAA